MSQTNDPTEFETEGSSAVGTANKGGKAAAKQVVDIAVSKASGSFGLPVIIGIAAVVLVVVVGILIMAIVLLSSAGEGDEKTQPGERFYGGGTSQKLERMKFRLNIYQSIKLLRKNMECRGIYLISATGLRGQKKDPETSSRERD